jgi:hypothetical protein
LRFLDLPKFNFLDELPKKRSLKSSQIQPFYVGCQVAINSVKEMSVEPSQNLHEFPNCTGPKYGMKITISLTIAPLNFNEMNGICSLQKNNYDDMNILFE